MDSNVFYAIRRTVLKRIRFRLLEPYKTQNRQRSLLVHKKSFLGVSIFVTIEFGGFSAKHEKGRIRAGNDTNRKMKFERHIKRWEMRTSKRAERIN